MWAILRYTVYPMHTAPADHAPLQMEEMTIASVHRLLQSGAPGDKP